MPRKSTRKQSPKSRVRVARRATPQATARDQALWMRAVFEHSALGIARLDGHARIVAANAAFEHFFDRTLRDLLGRSIREFAVAEDSEAIITLVAEALAGRSNSAAREARFVRQDGKLAWGALMLSRTAGGRRAHCGGADISSRRSKQSCSTRRFMIRLPDSRTAPSSAIAWITR
jgi:PAS domain S-box-containing protein